MTDALVHSAEIVKRVTDAECAYTLSRLGVLERLPGNPVGVAHKRVGDAYALLARYLPNPSFNRVVGLLDDQADEVAALVDWFESHHAAGRFEILPSIECPRVLAALTKAGYAHSGFHAMLFGAPARAPQPAPGVTIEVVDASTLETFLDCYSAGWGIGDPVGFKNNVRGWLGQPGWTIYLGRWQGKPAGGAILYLDGKTGYCADAAVDPAQRGHGVQQALLHQRSADAWAGGADLLCSLAAFLSTSQRNMIRTGMSLLCTKAIWTRAAP